MSSNEVDESLRSKKLRIYRMKLISVPFADLRVQIDKELLGMKGSFVYRLFLNNIVTFGKF
jgi:hypothetical protein